MRDRVTATPLLIAGGRIIDPSQGIHTIADLLIVDGSIAQVCDGKEALPCGRYSVLRAQSMVVAPGFIDLHCHLREPGYEEKETIATGTKAATRGGFTTLCAMPNTNPPVDSRASVEYIFKVAASEGAVRVLPIGCITKGRKGEELAEMAELAQAGAVAFSDDGSPVANPRLMRHALEYNRGLGLPVIDHCLDPTLSEGGMMNEGWVATRLGLKGSPVAAEEIMVARDIFLAQLTGARLHIAHVTTKGAVELIRRAKEKGLAVTAEVTPHHLTMTQDWVMGWRPGRGGDFSSQPINYDTNAKVNPPLRTSSDVEALIQGLRQGVIDAIATDHAPHTLVDKLCEFDLAAFGISGLETALGSLMALVHRGELDLPTLISRLTQGPARVLGREMGSLRVGMPGDVTIFEPEREWVVDPAAFASKGKNTPLAGLTLKGKVMATVVGGKVVFKDDVIKLASAWKARVARHG